MWITPVPAGDATKECSAKYVRQRLIEITWSDGCLVLNCLMTDGIFECSIDGGISKTLGLAIEFTILLVT